MVLKEATNQTLVFLNICFKHSNQDDECEQASLHKYWHKNYTTGTNLSSTDFVRTGNIILQVYFITQVHLGCANLMKPSNNMVSKQLKINK